MIWLLAGCFALSPGQGGGVADPPAERSLDAADVLLPDGFAIEPVARGLTFPTGVTFDDDGGIYVVEAGYSYGEVFLTPRIVRVDQGRLETVVEGGHPPWNGALWHDGAFLVAEGGEVGGGRIVRHGPDGAEVLVDGLPSLGDHHTNEVVIGPDGALYFGQGTATNAGVVGPDNAKFGWLERHPDFHDVPCRDVVLAGEDFTEGGVTTGAFVPHGTPTSPGQVVPGQVPCSGAIFRLADGELELYAWGLRNPYGLAFGPDGALYVAEHGYDDRGSRPVFGAPDFLRRIAPGAWHGWPEYAANQPLLGPPGGRKVPRLLAEDPGEPPAPAAVLGVHAAAGGLAFAPGRAWGEPQVVYVALFGDMAPDVGKVLAPVGFQVVRVDVATGRIETFASNRGKKIGPASLYGGGGLERPLDVAFDPEGRALYVVDFGVMGMTKDGPVPVPGTGVLWRIRPTGDAPMAER